MHVSTLLHRAYEFLGRDAYGHGYMRWAADRVQTRLRTGPQDMCVHRHAHMPCHVEEDADTACFDDRITILKASK